MRQCSIVRFHHTVSKMSLKFCANLNFMFLDNGANAVERYRAAKAAGFKAVEGGIPPANDITLEELVRVQQETGLEQVLLNIATGDVKNGQFGCAAFINMEEEFKKNLEVTINYAKALNCKKIHLMAGKVVLPCIADNHMTYKKNLRMAVKLLEKENIIGVIEPINKYAVPDYYLNNYEFAIDVLKEINSPNLKLMVDIFHLQHIKGNITNNLLDMQPFIGHIQIAQVPNRHEPNADGEINYSYVFKQLEAIGYKDWIGCEYKPKNGSLNGLTWIHHFGYEL